MPNIIDPREIRQGYNGRLYDLDGNFLANVPRFRMRVMFANGTHQPAGHRIDMTIPNRLSVEFTMTETVLDDDLLSRVLDGLTAEEMPVFNFKARLKGIESRGARNGWYTFYDCIIDGDVDILNIEPGMPEVQRPWTMKCNRLPEALVWLTRPARAS